MPSRIAQTATYIMGNETSVATPMTFLTHIRRLFHEPPAPCLQPIDGETSPEERMRRVMLVLAASSALLGLTRPQLMAALLLFEDAKQDHVFFYERRFLHDGRGGFCAPWCRTVGDVLRVFAGGGWLEEKGDHIRLNAALAARTLAAADAQERAIAQEAVDRVRSCDLWSLAADLEARSDKQARAPLRRVNLD